MFEPYIQFSSVQPLDRLGPCGGHWDDSAQILFHCFLSAGGHSDQFWHGQGCPLFDVVHSAFPLPPTASSSLQGVLKDGFGEAVVVCDMPEPCKFPPFNIRQKRFLWTHTEVDLAPHPVVGLVPQVENARKFFQALDFENLDPFFGVSKQGRKSRFIFRSQQAGSMSDSQREGRK